MFVVLRFLLLSFEFSVWTSTVVWHVSTASPTATVRAVSVYVCVCVSNACHVTKLYNFQTGRTSPIVTFPVNLAPAQPGPDPNPGTDRGMDLAVPHIFDTWPGKSQEKCATNNFSHLSLSLFTAALQNAITFPSGEGGGRWGAGRKVT